MTVGAYVKTNGGELLYLLGLGFEVYGTALMARRYTKAPLRLVPLELLSAFVRGKRAAKAATLGEKYLDESGLDILQGLSFLIVGFVLRTIKTIIALLP